MPALDVDLSLRERCSMSRGMYGSSSAAMLGVGWGSAFYFSIRLIIVSRAKL